MKYSVIVPAYQAENTILRCLDSLLAGIRSDTEIIVVSDGSTDRTDEICSAYAERIPQIRYFRKPNGGVSSARNLGLSHACGEYVMFVDSDDYVAADYFSAIDAHLSDDCDFLMFGKSVFDGNVTRDYPLCNYAADTPQKTAAFLSRTLRRQELNAPFTKVFRRKILLEHGIRFDDRLSIGEDNVFVVQYMVHARNAAFFRQPLYIMSIENGQSLSRKKRCDLCDQVLLEHQLLFEAVEDSAFRTVLKKAVSFSYHRSAYTVIRELRKFDYSRQQRLARIREICRRYAARKDCAGYSLWHWLLSLPIRLEMAELIDFVLRRKRLK